MHRNEEAGDLLLASAWLAAHDAQVAADIWDKAYQAGAEDMLLSPRDARENPYRQKSIQDAH